MNNVFLRIFLLTGFFCTTGLLTAQTVSHSVVNPMAGNVLMKGIPNHISIGLQGQAADSIEVSAIHAKVHKETIWHWIIIPDTAYTSVYVVVKAYKKRKPVSVDSTFFRLKWLPDPRAFIENRTGTNDSIQRSFLGATVGVFARAENLDQDVAYKVVSFGMRLDDGSARYHVSKDPFLTAGMKAAILAAKPGTRAIFDHIMVRFPDGRVKEVDGITLLLK